MSPLSKVDLTQRRDERRQQIKRAALAIFARHGYADAKMSMIATEARVSHGLFYRYFRSKDELYTELVDELMTEARTALGSVAELPGTPLEKLTALTAAMLDEDHRMAFMLIYKARTQQHPPKKVKQILARASGTALIEPLVPLFVRGQRSGELAAGDPRQLLGWYFAVINSLLVYELNPQALPSADVLIRMLRAAPKRP